MVTRNFILTVFFGFISLISSLQALVLRTGFWKDFLIADHCPFLSECNNNYGLLLNINWLQPYKYIEYSVGVMYLVIFNLPSSIRFKRENIPFGVFPGPCEPSLSVNSYLSPLISDLLDLWKGVQLRQPGTDAKALFRYALLGVACDLPAARKTCGLSYTANLGCSRCYQNFSHGFAVRSCCDNFERDNWEMHSNSHHRSDVKEILKCSTKTEKVRTLVAAIQVYLIYHTSALLKCF